MEGEARGEMVRSDSAVCCRIVLAFLDFLNSVEPATGVDIEGLDVARDCLEEVFKLNQSTEDDEPQHGLLISLFSSLMADDQHRPSSEMSSVEVHNTSCTASASQQHKDSNCFPSNLGNQTENKHVSGDLKDELFVKFYAALDRINFFSTSIGEIEDPLRVAKATQLFDDAVKEIEISQDLMNLINLAETFKNKGNLSMKLKFYPEAVELYTCAIALCEKNAVYYCNRAAAYTQVEKFIEAIEDCLKSIEIDPSYSKAYSRLGLAYYKRGCYAEALEKGFLRALQLDPNNESIKESIRAAQQKLVESSAYGTDRNTGSNHGQDSTAKQGGSTSRSGNSCPPFPFIFENSAIPPGLINNVRNVVSAATQELHDQMGSNVNLNMPEDSRAGHAEESATQGGSANTGVPFASFPFVNNASLAHEFANMVNGLSSSSTQGAQASAGMPGNNSGNHNEPEITIQGNVNLNFSELPEQVRDTLLSYINRLSSQNGPERHA